MAIQTTDVRSGGDVRPVSPLLFLLLLLFAVGKSPPSALVLGRMRTYPKHEFQAPNPFANDRPHAVSFFVLSPLLHTRYCRYFLLSKLLYRANGSNQWAKDVRATASESGNHRKWKIMQGERRPSTSSAYRDVSI